MDIKPGDIILWKGGGNFTNLLSGILALKDKSWRARYKLSIKFQLSRKFPYLKIIIKKGWLPWHTGFVVKVLDTGEIVTFQAVNLFTGVCAVTYASVADMGDCKIYHWLDNPDPAAIERYVDEWNGVPYDALAYFWVIVTVLFNWHFSITDKRLMCWENLSNFCQYMGKELQPCWEEPLISKMMNALDSCQNKT